MDSDTYVCPKCGQPVEAVARRHKTLGAWVPVWAPGPCRNPKCAAGPEPNARTAEAGARPETVRHPRGATAENP
ncbi:hypothetical protein ABS735_14375 [Streptomyces sp. MMCC 100]|uniref:hypothetical protein n=1 Tax=Streptomyces sp. MMCC 100 TaxID=3163555 RepID=UPI003597F544